LVFTAGIGEHSPVIRRRIAEGLAFLGVHIDPRRNDASEERISLEGAAVVVSVIPTNEEVVIARHTAALAVGSAAP
jgi:acetate kinase